MIEKITLLRAATALAEFKADGHDIDHLREITLRSLISAAQDGQLAVERAIERKRGLILPGEDKWDLNWGASLVATSEFIRWVAEENGYTYSDVVKKTGIQRDREPGFTLSRLCEGFKRQHGRIPTRGELYEAAITSDGTAQIKEKIHLALYWGDHYETTKKRLKDTCGRVIRRLKAT